LAIGPGEVKEETPRSMPTAEREFAPVFIDGLSGQFYGPGLPRNWSAGITLLWR
jgi:hypothetical protein